MEKPNMEPAAFAFLEKIIWDEGKPVCPHCGSINNSIKLKKVKPRRKVKDAFGGVVWKYSPERFGLWKCRVTKCRKQFTVMVGTVLENSHLSAQTWTRAITMFLAADGDIKATVLEAELKITYKAAWNLRRRLREIFDK